MDSSNKKKRAINFDLNIASLKKYYSKSNPKNAYREIGKFFYNNDFDHRQGSGYVSRKPLSKTEVLHLIDQLNKTFPWLDKCSTHIDLTDIGQTYDLKELYNKRKHSERDNINKPPSKKTKLSLSERIAHKQELINQREKQKNPQKRYKSNEREL